MREGYVSIIIPLYNGEKYIERTLTCIRASKYEQLEIIIVDDGSKDRGIDICRRLQREDQRIVIYSKENGGIVTARNYGVEQATGEYITFCDQDDIVENTMYAKLVKALEQDQGDLVMCSNGRYVNGQRVEWVTYDDGTYEGDAILAQLIYPLLFNGYRVPLEMSGVARYPSVWNCLFRKQFWDKYGFRFRAYINFEDDLLLLIEALSTAKKVITISDREYYWRVNPKSETYARKFVDSIAYRQQQAMLDIITSIRQCGVTEEVIDMYKCVAWCRFYVDSVHNLMSPQMPKDRRSIVKYIKENIYGKDFKKNIKARNWLRKGRVKPKILLFFLDKRMPYTCYLSERILDWILLIVLRNSVLLKIERRMKKEK